MNNSRESFDQMQRSILTDLKTQQKVLMNFEQTIQQMKLDEQAVQESI